jgi:divalent metal cation (Fe/Co/Zn/Cd) transporter
MDLTVERGLTAADLERITQAVESEIAQVIPDAAKVFIEFGVEK